MLQRNACAKHGFNQKYLAHVLSNPELYAQRQFYVLGCFVNFGYFGRK